MKKYKRREEGRVVVFFFLFFFIPSYHHHVVFALCVPRGYGSSSTSWDAPYFPLLCLVLFVCRNPQVNTIISIVTSKKLMYMGGKQRRFQQTPCEKERAVAASTSASSGQIIFRFFFQYFLDKAASLVQVSVK